MIDFQTMEKFHPEKYPRNDIGTSNLFATIFKNELVFVPERKSFFVFDGKIWKRDLGDLKTHELAKEFAVSVTEYFRTIKEESEDVLKYYTKYLSRDKRRKLIEDVRSVIPMNYDKFDRQAYYFNCQNGTVNLLTGDIHPHDPADYITKMSGIWYDPEANSKHFEDFINSIMEGKAELINYLQRALGYSLSAATFQECFFITYGSTTRNGKGTLNNTMQTMLGDYAKVAPYEAFESKKFKSSGGANPDIACLAGARYVSVSEPAEGMVLDSALVKTLSGNDKVSARHLYEEPIEFTASFKLWINTNHLPVIPDDTVFKSGRVQLIPFNRHFSADEQDRGLKARLIQKENLSGAFNWCLAGLQFMAEEGGLQVPELIKNEVAKYRENNDRIGDFIKECLISDMNGTHKEKISNVYRVYSGWCRESGYKPWGKKIFKEKLGEREKIEIYAKQDHLYGFHLSKDIPKEWTM